MSRRLILVAIMLILIFPAYALAQLPKYPPIPDALIVKMKQEEIKQKNGSEIDAFYPTTKQPSVNDDLRAVIDGYINRLAPSLPSGKKTPKDSKLYIRCAYSPTGDSWLSFLVLARTVYYREQTGTELTARTYDISNGKRIMLTDLFPADSPAWDVLANAASTQLAAYFPEEPDFDKLKALTSRDALKNAEFTLGAVKLELHYPAAVLYPGRVSVMHVKVYYRELAGMMTDEAARQTDNSRYPMIALTFDDGPRYVGTVNLLDQLQAYGAKATFFLIGDQMADHRDVVQREHDEGHLIASHTWNHYDPRNLTAEQIFEGKQMFDTLLSDIIGLNASYMRGPGGRYQEFVKAGIGLPLIHWSVIGGDINTNEFGRIKGIVVTNAKDGAIVLLHDSKSATAKAIGGILYLLQKKGFLCVTVEDLFYQKGLTLKPNSVYRDTSGPTEEILP